MGKVDWLKNATSEIRDATQTLEKELTKLEGQFPEKVKKVREIFDFKKMLAEKAEKDLIGKIIYLKTREEKEIEDLVVDIVASWRYHKSIRPLLMFGIIFKKKVNEAGACNRFQPEPIPIYSCAKIEIIEE